MNDNSENFDPKTFEEMTSLQEETEWEQNHIPEVTEIDASRGELLDKPFVNPILKLSAVIILVSFVVAVPVIIGATLVATFNNRKSNPAPKQASNLLEENQQEEIEELKTAMAQIEIQSESKKLEEAPKPKPTPKPATIKTEVPISKQPEPVAEQITTPQPPPTITPEPVPIPPTPKVEPVVTQELPTPIYIPPAPPKPQPVEKVRIVKVPATVKDATKPKALKPTQNPNPVRSWDKLANYGYTAYTLNTPSKIPKQPKQTAVPVVANYPVSKARRKVNNKTTNPEQARKWTRLRHRLKSHSLAKSNFKTQKRLQIKTVSAMEAAQPINAEVAQGYGLVINFQQLGEVITQTWISDPSQIVFKARNGVIFVRQIEKLDFPSLTRSTDGGTQLVVLTNSQYGTKQYTFHLIPVKGNASYSGIVLKPNQQKLIQPSSNFTNTI